MRYSTTGSSTISNAQPFVVRHKNKSYAVAHNGNLVNAQKLKNELEESGSFFQTTMDSEIFLHLFVKNIKHGFENALVKTVSKLKGAFSFVALTSNGIKSIKAPNTPKRSFCIFEFIYFARPDSIIFGQNVYLMRKAHGRCLAKEAPVDADLVMPFPDSGTCAALGYSEECRTDVKSTVL